MGQQNLNEYFTDLLQKVDLQIQDFEDNNNDPFSLCKQVIDYLQEITGELKTFIISYSFTSKEEEISFRAEMIRFKLLVLSLQLELMRKSWAN